MAVPVRKRKPIPPDFVKFLKACRNFYDDHPEYRAGDSAAGECFVACVEFQEYLFDLKLICENGREKVWDVIEVLKVANRKVPYHCKHWVFWYHGLAIDWTAKQFWDDASTPTIWLMETNNPLLGSSM